VERKPQKPVPRKMERFVCLERKEWRKKGGKLRAKLGDLWFVGVKGRNCRLKAYEPIEE